MIQLIFYFLYTLVYVQGVEFSFFLESEEKLCFVDVLAPNTLLIAKIRSQTDQYNFYMTHQSQNGQVERIYESQGKMQLIYDYTTMLGGNYQFCFEDKLGLYNEIYFEYLIGVEANDMHEIAQKSDLALVQETLNNIQAKLQFMKQQLIIFSQVKLENIFSLESLYYYIMQADFISCGIIVILILLEIYILKKKILRKKIQ